MSLSTIESVEVITYICIHDFYVRYANRSGVSIILKVAGKYT
jgi:hypothetical protein